MFVCYVLVSEWIYVIVIGYVGVNGCECIFVFKRVDKRVSLDVYECLGMSLWVTRFACESGYIYIYLCVYAYALVYV